MQKKSSNQHRQNQATGYSNSRWFKFKFDSRSRGWFFRICSSDNSRRDRSSRSLVSYGGSGSGSGRSIGTNSGWSGVYHLGNLETSSDDSVVKWLYGTEITDTCRGVSLPELTKKVHLRKRNPKLATHQSRQSLFLSQNRLVFMINTTQRYKEAFK